MSSMLQSLRTGSKSPIMKIFLLFLAGGFAIWGIGDVSTGLFGPGDKAIKAGSESVSAVQVAEEFDFVRRSQYSGVSTGDAIEFGLLSDVISRMARTTLFEAEATELGIVSTRSMQKSALLRQAAFQDETGAFSQGRFISALAQAGLSEQDYLTQLDKSMISQQISDTLTLGVKFPESLSEEFAKFELERRKVQLISFDINPDQQPIPENTVLQSWFEENSETYAAPALRDIKTLVISPETLLDDVVITDAELQEAFQQRGEEFSTPERRIVKQILFDTSEQALAARNAIDSGTSFVEIANTLLGLSEEDISLGDVTYTDVEAAMADPIFNAEAGELIGPIDSIFGFNLAVVDLIIKGNSNSFEDVKEDIREVLQNEGAVALVYDKLNAFEDALGTGATLDEVAAQNNFQTSIIYGVDQQGNTIDGVPFDGTDAALVALTEFLENSWDAGLDEISTVVDAGNDVYYVVQPIAESPPRTRDFDEVKSRVLADYNLQNAIATSKAEAEARLRLGPSIFDNVTPTNGFRRSGVGLDNENARLVAQTAFGQSLLAASIIETGSQIIIVRTAEIVPADTTEVADTTSFYSTQLNIATSRNISEALSANLSETHKLELYPGMVQQILLGQSSQ